MKAVAFFPGTFEGHKAAWSFFRVMEKAGWSVGYPHRDAIDAEWSVRVEKGGAA